MAKPDVKKTAFMTQDGGMWVDFGRGYTERPVKGATSERLYSKVLEEDSAFITIPEVPRKPLLKIMLDVYSEAHTANSYKYALNFNGDIDYNYISSPLQLWCIIINAFPAGQVGNQTRVWGSIGLSNDEDLFKLGNGYVTSTRGNNSLVPNAPAFCWRNTDSFIDKIDIFAITAANYPAVDHVFRKGSRVQVLGRDFF